MAIVEFDQEGRTYRVELAGYDSKNIYSLNLIRDKVTISTDLVTDEQVFVAWDKIAIMRIIS